MPSTTYCDCHCTAACLIVHSTFAMPSSDALRPSMPVAHRKTCGGRGIQRCVRVRCRGFPNNRAKHWPRLLQHFRESGRNPSTASSSARTGHNVWPVWRTRRCIWDRNLVAAGDPWPRAGVANVARVHLICARVNKHSLMYGPCHRIAVVGSVELDEPMLSFEESRTDVDLSVSLQVQAAKAQAAKAG